MVRFSKIRQSFTALVGEVIHEAGVIIVLTEKEFEAVAHKVEELPRDLARALHLTKGHALAISPAAIEDAGDVPAIMSGDQEEQRTDAPKAEQADAPVEVEHEEPAMVEPEAEHVEGDNAVEGM